MVNVYILFLYPQILLNKYLNLTIIVFPFLIYTSFIYFEFSFFYKYLVSIFQLSIWISLVQLSKKNIKISIALNKVFIYFPYFLLATQIGSLLSPEITKFLNLFKYNHHIYNTTGFIRGYPGILPEPGYVGASISASIVGYFVSKSILIRNFNTYFTYKKLNKFLFENSYLYLAVSAISIILSLSLASVISALVILPFFFICLQLSRSTKLKDPIKLKTISVFFIGIYFVVYIAYGSFKTTRLLSLSNNLITNPLVLVQGRDQSAADRFNSSLVGFVTPIINPFGYGLNAYPRIFNDCEHPIPKKFNLMCENIFNSQRNNNILSNFTQDGGVIGLITILCILFYSMNIKFINLKKLILIFGVLFIGLFLPFPIGSSIFWVLTTYLFSI